MKYMYIYIYVCIYIFIYCIYTLGRYFAGSYRYLACCAGTLWRVSREP
jgi:hypothetical protein